MNNMKFTFISVFILGLFSCAEKKGEEISSTFREVHSYQLNLDRFTSPAEDYYQYIKNWKGQEAYAFHVMGKEEIKLYNLGNGALIETLAYGDNQPNLQSGIHDFYILNEDSIFLNRRRAYKVYLINQEFEIVKAMDFMGKNDEIDKNTGWPKSKETFMPVWSRNRFFRKIGDKIFVSGAPNMKATSIDATNTKTLLNSYSLGTEEITPLLGYPEKMQGKIWGEFFDMVSSDYSQEEDFFVHSYAADGRVYIMDQAMHVIHDFEAFPKGYKNVPPLTVKEIESTDALSSHWQDNDLFGSIHWDPYRKLIYRIMEEPNVSYNKDMLLDPLERARNMVVMAFDTKQDYRKVAEMRLKKSEKGIYLDRCFVNEKGFNITYVDLENEDKLYFKTFLVE
ncbi:DUF4221 family protein [Rhodonellum ikkaensis]|uniref:DUF4221 domain-containing protein n=1 Tax=Rhodonellum ikkaensis TaxID=336829 RepID=A0A1H3UC90_9BACT|nr:DUF4221 family protein [Rhodonellum ikkaensis]SDZ59937.1 protein of unknown function [Rhodonellum ikkaensis]